MVSPTLPGMITLVGLFPVACILSNHDKRISDAFCCFFLTFLSVNFAFHSNSTDVIQKFFYIVPATLSIGFSIWIFRKNFNPRNILFISIFGINSIGNLFGLDNYKIVNVDFLDILTWIQLITLVHLGINPPKEGVYG